MQLTVILYHSLCLLAHCLASHFFLLDQETVAGSQPISYEEFRNTLLRTYHDTELFDTEYLDVPVYAGSVVGFYSGMKRRIVGKIVTIPIPEHGYIDFHLYCCPTHHPEIEYPATISHGESFNALRLHFGYYDDELFVSVKGRLHFSEHYDLDTDPRIATIEKDLEMTEYLESFRHRYGTDWNSKDSTSRDRRNINMGIYRLARYRFNRFAGVFRYF